MTTTPRLIDYNGIKISSQDTATSLIASAISNITAGVDLNYIEGTSKTFSMNSSGFTLSPNTSSFNLVTSTQQLLNSLTSPPNASTLLVQNNVQINNGGFIANINHATPGTLTFDGPTGGRVVFQQVPSSLVGPTANNDLTTKSYVDNLNATRGLIVDGTTSNINPFMLYAGASGNALYTGSSADTNGIQYNPLNGTTIGQKFRVIGGNSRVCWGNTRNSLTTLRNNAHNVLFGDGMIDTSDTTLPSTCCAIFGWSAGVSNVPAGLIAFGRDSAQSFSNPGGSLNTASANTIAIGKGAQQTNPTLRSVAIGYEAANFRATPQRTTYNVGEVAIGYQSSYTYGNTSGAPFSVSIGYRANYNTTRPFTAGTIGSVCINAGSTALNTGNTSACYIAPIRGFTAGKGVNQLLYDYDASVTGTTGEIYYSTN